MPEIFEVGQKVLVVNEKERIAGYRKSIVGMVGRVLERELVKSEFGEGYIYRVNFYQDVDGHFVDMSMLGKFCCRWVCDFELKGWE
jgi:hypothetical protein